MIEGPRHEPAPRDEGANGTATATALDVSKDGAIESTVEAMETTGTLRGAIEAATAVSVNVAETENAAPTNAGAAGTIEDDREVNEGAIDVTTNVESQKRPVETDTRIT